MYVPTYVTDAIAEWLEESDLLKNKQPDAPGSSGEIQPEWGSDRDRANLFLYLQDVNCLTIKKWHVEFVTEYLKWTLPPAVLERHGNHPSLFLKEIYAGWSPSDLESWIGMLWLYSKVGGYHYFAYLVRLNHFSTGRPDFLKAQDLSNLGLLLIDRGKDVYKFGEDVQELLVGNLIWNARDPSAVLDHARDIMRLLHRSEMVYIGAGCRYLLRYRTRPRDCDCPSICICARKLLEMDNSRKYGFELLRELFEILDSGRLSGLSKEDNLQAKRVVAESACRTVYTVDMYNELCRALELPPPNLPLSRPRELSDAEIQNLNGSYTGNVEKAFELGTRWDCLYTGCTALAKEECRNRMCKAHCFQRGRHDCRAHNKFSHSPRPR